MSSQSATATPGRPTPGRPAPAARSLQDLTVGLFFLAWAAAGWLSVAGNELMFSDLYAGLDPGPSLMPLVVLSAITLGGAAILATALARLLLPGRLRPAPAPADGQAPAETDEPTGLRRHIVPLGLLATLAVYPTIMEALGYAAATALFVLGWILALTGWRRLHARDERLVAGAVALLSTALIVGILYLGFVVVIHAPLP